MKRNDKQERLSESSSWQDKYVTNASGKIMMISYLIAVTTSRSGHEKTVRVGGDPLSATASKGEDG